MAEKITDFPLSFTSARRLKTTTIYNLADVKMRLLFATQYGKRIIFKESGSYLKLLLDQNRTPALDDLASYYYLLDIENNIPEAEILDHQIIWNKDEQNYYISGKYKNKLMGEIREMLIMLAVLRIWKNIH